MDHIVIVDHPLIRHSLTILRDRNTKTAEFRRHADVVSKILLIEATKHLTLRKKNITTPLAAMTGERLVDDIVVVPVLRAGLAMLVALQDFLPSVSVGFIGLERDEKTAKARQYYEKIPDLVRARHVFVVDPMLATGGSFDDTIRTLKEKGAKTITAVSIVAAPPGIERIQHTHPDVKIITSAIDDALNDKKYIVPGLGDFGDRYFGTD